MHTQSDFAAWLATIGLGEYVELLTRHGVDFDVVADLSEQDLIGLNISLGDRKRLLRATALLARDKPTLSPPSPRRQADMAERRRVTILFCDLVDSTGLANRLDPEETSAVISAYLHEADRIAHQYGGYIDRLVGDGLLIFFGWPTAHEDQVERAAAAGLDIVKAVGGLLEGGSRPPLACRIGIATGEVVVGDVAGGGRRWESVFGSAPNLAARLQSVAAPNSVVVDAATAEDLRAGFVLQELDPAVLKGFADPVPAWRVTRRRPRSSRFFARVPILQPLVGRAHELARLIDAWRRVENGNGRALLVAGEPGIGKSHLLETLVASLGLPERACLRFQCDPLHSDMPLYPVVQQIGQALNLEPIQDAEARRRKIGGAVDPIFPEDPDMAERFAALFESGDGKAAAREPPAARRRRTLEGLAEFVLRSAKERPVVAFVEDIQWIDPSTEQVLRLILERLEGARVLLALTSRAMDAPDWFAGPHTETAPLARLNREDSETLVRGSAERALDDETVARIAETADGIPLFLEEMTRCALEQNSDSIFDGDGFGKRSAASLPATLQASLNSRLDRLGGAKRTAQIAAVIGRDVPIPVLAEVAGRAREELHPDVEKLVQSGLATRLEDTANPALRFRHALFQEAAYRSLLLSERKRLHNLALAAYERRIAQPDGQTAQLLSSHAIQAERWDRAAHYVGLAYSNAVRRSANREAVSLFHRAIDVIGRLPQDIAAPLAIDLRLHAFTAFHTLGENDRLVELIREAARLAEMIGDRRRLTAASIQTAFALWMNGKHREAQKNAEAALALAELPKDFSIVLSILFNLANIHHAQGNLAEAVALHRRVLSMLQGGLENKRIGWQAPPSVFSRAFASWCLLELGAFAEAADLLAESETYPDPPEPHGRVMLGTGRGALFMRRGDFVSAADVLGATLELCQRSEVLTMTPIVAAWYGHALCGAGRVAQALDVVGDAVERETYKFGGKYTWIHLRLALAEARRLAGQIDRAGSEARIAQGIARECGEVVHLAYANAELARIALAAGDPREALPLAEEALKTARDRVLPPLTADCLLAKAQAHAAAGDGESAKRASDEARAILEKLIPGEPASKGAPLTTARSG